MHARWVIDKRVIYFPLPSFSNMDAVITESQQIMKLLDDTLPEARRILKRELPDIDVAKIHWGRAPIMAWEALP